jgi:hypothetical protein
VPARAHGSAAPPHRHTASTIVLLASLRTRSFTDGARCGTHWNGVFRSDDGGRCWRSVGPAGRLITSIAASAVERDVVRVSTEPSEVWRSANAGTSCEQTSRLETLPSSSEWWFPPRPGHAPRSLDRVPPARTGTTLGCDRGRRARVHSRGWPHLARPRHGWFLGHPRTRGSPRRSGYLARVGRRCLFRKRRCRGNVALAEHGSRGRLLAQRGDRTGAAGRRCGVSVVRTVHRVRGLADRMAGCIAD